MFYYITINNHIYLLRLRKTTEMLPGQRSDVPYHEKIMTLTHNDLQEAVVVARVTSNHFLRFGYSAVQRTMCYCPSSTQVTDMTSHYFR